MAKFTIYSKDGNAVRHLGEPQYNGSYMGVDFIEFRTISSPTIIDWQIGDYVDYYRIGKRYRLYSLPMPKKVANKGMYGAAFEYSNVQLHGATKELEIAPFRDLVSDDNDIHFSTRPDVSTYENVYGIARRIQECINDIFPNRWRIEVFDTKDADLLALLNETKEYSVSNGSCLDALSQIYETWKNVGWIHTYDSANDVDVITIGRANVRDTDNTSDAFAYGIGKGLTSIKKASANEGEFATRLYVYGSERNIQTRYYNGFDILNKDSVDIRNLMLPIEKWGKTNGLPDPSKAYLQADDSIIEKYGLIPRIIYFDGNENEEIYPSIKGLTMAKVRKAMIDAGQGDSEYLPEDSDTRIDQVRNASVTDSGDKESIEKNRTFGMILNAVGFNIAEQGKLTSEGYATISMKSGMCAGRDFKVLKCQRNAIDNSLILTLERTWDESLGMGFPNTTYPIVAGEEFVLLDIPMPDYYITLASERLLNMAEKTLADYTRVSAFYEPSVDAIKIKEGGKLIQAGMYMQMYDEDIIDTEDNKDYVLIDTLTIDEKSDLPLYKVTLREQKRSARTFGVLEEMIDDAKESVKQDIKRERQYTDRRFRSSQDTLELLQAAFTNFSEGISPVTVRTMAMLVGDESLQFKFTESRESLVSLDTCPLYYDETTKQMKGDAASLVHMTLGIDAVTSPGTRTASDYRSWDISAKDSAVLDDAEKSYYVYVKAHQSDTTAEYILSDIPIGMEDECNEEDTGYYHFLVGILNSEYNSTRDFVTLYGFTEILPGQITTDAIRSSNGQTYFDLVKGEIGGNITFRSSSGEKKSVADFEQEQNAQLSVVDKSIDNLQDQIDGVVENHFFDGEPTTTNQPASSWITDEQKINHIGDTYTDIEEFVDSATTPNAGKSWRWCRCDDVAGITDYVEATDKDGTIYKLHWHPIADTDAVKALLRVYELEKRVDDAEYLKHTFEKGETNIAGGVVMTEMVAVGDSGNVIEAFFNGSDFATDSDIDPHTTNSCGKLILASGIPEVSENGSVKLEDRAKEANTRLYKDGCLFSNKIHLREGCSISENIEVTSDGIKIDTPIVSGQTYINEEGLKVEGKIGSDKDFNFWTSFGNCGDQVLDIRVLKEGVPFCYLMPKNPIGIMLDIQDGLSIAARRGMFAGFRPMTRVVTTKGSESSPNLITEYDHTIFVDAVPSSASTYYFQLPEPEPGQYVQFFNRGKYCAFKIKVTAYTWGNNNANEFSKGSFITFESGSRRHIEFQYVSGLGWMFWHRALGS